MLGLAEQCLGVPKLVDPNDLLSYPEEKSVMTYIGMLFRVNRLHHTSCTK